MRYFSGILNIIFHILQETAIISVKFCEIFVKRCVISTSYTAFHKDHTELHGELIILIESQII
jgi:hypothetical protein